MITLYIDHGYSTDGSGEEKPQQADGEEGITRVREVEEKQSRVRCYS